MSWDERPDLAAGVYPTAEQLEAILDEIERLDNPPRCVVRRAAGQTLTTGVADTVDFDTETKDTDTMFTATSDTVTIRTAGDYDIHATTTFADNATGIRVLEILHQGATVAHETGEGAGAQQGRMSASIGVLTCAAGDVIKLQVFQNSGGNLTVTARMSVARVGT